MSSRRHALAFGLVMAAISHTGLAQTEAAEALVEQGVYWESQRDYDRADEAWKKLLLVVPNHARAWYGLGMSDVARSDFTGARSYVEKLKRQDPKGRYVAPLEQAIALGSGNGPALLAEARKYNDEGDWDKAIAKFNQALGNRPPVGDIALEYYRYLSNTKDGWAATKAGLERLQSATPGDPRIPLAIAMLEIRNEATRYEGIKRMAELTKVKAISGYADEGWRMALTWISPGSEGSTAAYEAYLKVHPDDAEIAGLLADSRKARSASAAANTAQAGPTTPPENVAGFKALEKGDASAAEADFLARLKKQPNDPDALGGMGVVRMQQGNMSEARDYLTKATRQTGGAAWNAPLSEVNSLDQIEQANVALRAGNTAQARQILDRVIKANPRSTLAENTLAGIEVDAGNYAAAEKIYRRVLARSKNDPTALAGLVGVLAATDRGDQARQVMDKIGTTQLTADQMQNVQSAYVKGVARAAIRRGDDAAARQALETAMSNDRENPYIRLELAQLYLKEGRVKEATGLVDGLLITKPDDPVALYASASIANARGDYAGALATLDRIQTKDRTANVVALQRQAWIQAQIAQATRLANQGRKAEALALLQQVEPLVGNNLGVLGALASAYVDAGDAPHAMRMLRQVMAGPNGKGAEVQLQYASILLKTNQDVEAGGVLADLGKRDLSSDQRRWYSDLVFTYSVRQAEVLRERGQLAASYDRLAPLLQQRPDDPVANGLLAQLYSSAGDNAKALEVAKRLVQRNPDNVGTQLSAAQIATLAKDYSFADTAIQTAITLAPNDSEVLGQAAGIYRQQGKAGKAQDLYERAVALQGGAGKAPGAAASGELAMVGTNPSIYAQGTSSAGVMTAVPVALAAADSTTAPNKSSVGLPDASGAAPVPPKPASLTGSSAQVVPYPSQGGATVADGPAAASAAAATPVPAPRQLGPVIAAVPLVTGSESTTSNSPLASTVVTPTEPFPASVPPPPVGDISPKSMLVALDEIRQDRAPEILVGAQYRQNNGTSGTSQLSDTETPIEIRFPVGDGKVALQVTPVWLNAGALASDFYSQSTFGGGPFSALSQFDGLLSPPGTQSANGVGVAVAYRMQGLTVDLGTTPLGFQYSNFTGGLKFDGTTGSDNSVYYMLNISSRPLTNSLLSFAGTKDSATGLTWGGVMASGARIQLSKNLGGYGFMGWASWYSLNGHNVADNNRTEAGLGWFWDIQKSDTHQFSTGLNLTGIWYAQNLGGFTYGQGGYFSPQNYTALMVPLTWAQRQDRYSFLVRGSVGIQNFTQNDSPYFPTDSNMQALANAAYASAASRGIIGSGNSATYAGQTSTSMAYNVGAAGEYQVAPQLFLGGSADFNNVTNYRQWGAGVYLRYSFYPMTRQLPMPISPYMSPYGQ